MARKVVQEKWHQLIYFYRSSGIYGVTIEILRKSIAAIYSRKTAHLLIYRVEPNGPGSHAVDAVLPLSMQHIVVKDQAALNARKRIGWIVVGQVRQIKILGGLIALQTSRKEVEDMLR